MDLPEIAHGLLTWRHELFVYLNRKADIDPEQRGKGWRRPDGHRIQRDCTLSQPSEAVDMGDDVGAVSKGKRRSQPQAGLDHQARCSQRNVYTLSDDPELASLADGAYAPGDRARHTRRGSPESALERSQPRPRDAWSMGR